MVTGSRFKDAFLDPGAYLAVEPLFEVCSLEKEINWISKLSPHKAFIHLQAWLNQYCKFSYVTVRRLNG